MNGTPDPYIFHAFEVSYFSAKVRPALRYKRLYYEERRADLREVQGRTGLGFIPILVTPEGETWQDSTDIYDRLEARHPEPPLFPSAIEAPVQRIAAHLVELYVDEFALIPAMHYRWGSGLGEASARARFSAMIGSVEVGNKAADRMVAARGAVGSTDENAPAVEAHTRDLLDALNAHFEVQPQLLGDRMSFADCALMGPLDGHLFSDLVSRRLLLETAVPVVGWIERTRFPSSAEPGRWLADDALAPSFRDVLTIMGRDAAPVVLDAASAFEAWADTRPADQQAPPRAVGTVQTTLRGLPVTRMNSAYLLFSLQRLTDQVRALSPDARKRVDEALAGTGWEAVVGYAPRHRLARRGYELVFEEAP